jgi:hypothetical protein
MRPFSDPTNQYPSLALVPGHNICADEHNSPIVILVGCYRKQHGIGRFKPYSRPDMRARIEIGQCFFGEAFQRGDLKTFEAYFRYYQSELAMLNFGSSPLSRRSTDLAVQTHEDVLFVARILQQSGAGFRPAVRLHMQSRFRDAKDIALNRSIDLTIRLWLSLNVREEAFKHLSPQTPAYEWNETSTLQDFLSGLFPTAQWQIQAREGRLHPYFTVANMIKICGLELEWTDSLEDHLRLDRRQKVLKVFPYKCCLMARLARKKGESMGASM